MQLALELTSRGPDAVVVIGDTPHDVACATEVGLRAIGLATGAHSSRELRDAGAWRVFERVPAAAALERLVLAAED